MKRKYNKIAVLMGGPSAEREISLISGAAVSKGLCEAGYDVIDVDVTGYDPVLPAECEAAFIALHGTFGEDGTVQDILERRGVPYTGPGPKASRISFDKRLFKEHMQQAGIPVPDYEIITKASQRTLPLPVVTKPLCQGSSLGVHRVVREPEWAAAFAATQEYGTEVMVETLVDGRELTVGIVDRQVLPIVEIRAPDGDYNYAAKYTSGQTQYVVPAELPDACVQACRDFAWRAYNAIACRGMSRFDFRMSGDGNPWLLENNTIPGFTPTSLLPKAAAAAGISFTELCRRIMEQACVDAMR